VSKIERILVVEDDPDLAILLQSRLEQLGYNAQVHTKAKEALSVAKAMKAQLVLLDVMLGDGIGYHVAQELRGDPLLYDIPILFQSVVGDERNVDHAREEGGDGYITKPYSAQELASSLARMQNLFDDLVRKCPVTGMQSAVQFRRKVDYRLVRHESFALFCLYPDIPQMDADETAASNIKDLTKSIGKTIDQVVRNVGFYETEASHMGNGFFMVMTKLDDRDRFKANLKRELLASKLRLKPGTGSASHSLKFVLNSTASTDRSYKHANEMFKVFMKLKKPPGDRKSKARPSAKK
jgi:CheY-like chemotaxis protein